MFSQINFIVLKTVTGKYLQMQNMNMPSNSVFLKKNSERVISAMSSRRNPVITELSSGVHTTSTPTAFLASKRLRFYSSFFNSWMVIRTCDTLSIASNFWKSTRVRVISNITIFVFGSFSNSNWFFFTPGRSIVGSFYLNCFGW